MASNGFFYQKVEFDLTRNVILKREIKQTTIPLFISSFKEQSSYYLKIMAEIAINVAHPVMKTSLAITRCL